MTGQELLNTAILTRLSYFHLTEMVALYRRLGSATAIVEQRRELPRLFPSLPRRVAEALADVETMRPRCEEELEYADRHGISVMCLADDAYPRRLKECPDAPLMLFYKGTADLNAPHVINIVGTRHATPYGKDLIRHFVARLRQTCPDTIIVSGLAYGIDITAHREALANGMETVAVLAHGLDTLYPSAHRDTANQMVEQGGLVTEYMTRTKADKLNFVRRNRITAGLCDATVLVESAAKGGGLITTRIAADYSREVFAFPGAVSAPYSEGCNNLIRDNGAALITSADDMLDAMGWAKTAKEAGANPSATRSMPEGLTPDEEKVVAVLIGNNDLQQNVISVKAALPIGAVISVLFQLEMKGLVKPYAGGIYHLTL